MRFDKLYQSVVAISVELLNDDGPQFISDIVRVSFPIMTDIKSIFRCEEFNISGYNLSKAILGLNTMCNLLSFDFGYF